MAPGEFKANYLANGMDAAIRATGAGQMHGPGRNGRQGMFKLALNRGLRGDLALKTEVGSAIILNGRPVAASALGAGGTGDICRVCQGYASPSSSTSIIMAILAASPGRRPILIIRV